MYLSVPALDVRSVGKIRLRGRDYDVQFSEWIVPQKPTLRSGLCRAEGNFDLVSKLRGKLPG